MSDKVLMVFTGKSRDRIIEEGGTSSWVLKPEVVRQFRYAVCTRNELRAEELSGANMGSEPHGSAFLVGRISGVKKVGERNGRDRYLVTFDAVAEVNVPDVWDGSRNPVRYIDAVEIEAKGIVFGDLAFKPLAPPTHPATALSPEVPSVAKPMTIAQAKAGLAATFGVPEGAIEIIIKG